MSNKWQQLMSDAGRKMHQRRFAQAKEAFAAAVAIAEQSADALLRLEALSGLGAAYAANKQFDLAEQVYCKAQFLCAISEELGNFPAAGCLISLAHIYRDQEKIHDSRASAERAVELLEADDSGDHPEAILTPLALLAELGLKESNFADAAMHLERAFIAMIGLGSSNCEWAQNKLLSLENQLPSSFRERLKAKLKSLQMISPLMMRSRAQSPW